MRKILSLFAAVLFAVVANAAVINITAETANSLKTAVNDASAGDTIVLAAGTYSEPEQVHLNKNITIMAAEGVTPVIALHYYFDMTSGAQVVMKGLKIDGGIYNNGAGASDHCVRPYDDSANKTLTMIDCEICNFANGFIFYPQRANRCMQSLTIQNCRFYNNARCIVYIETGSSSPLPLAELTIENSTIAGNYSSYKAIDLKNGGSEVADAKMRIDHCTFYNCGPVRSEKSTDVVISNCIFAAPTADAYAATTLYAGAAINNSLSFNVALDEASTKTACITGDPLFAAAATGDFTLGATSPALTAASDGGAIGDPRWAPAPAPIGAPAYFLVGNMNNWKPDSAYMFAVNPANENEYMLNTTLAVGDSVKVLGIVGNTQTWYPDNAPNYAVDAAHAGKKTIYFQTTYKADWAEFGGYIWMEANPAPVAPTDPYTMTFTYNNKVDGDGSAKLTTAAAIFAEASQKYVAKVDTGIQVYAGRKYKEGNDSIFSNLKLGSSSAVGELKFILAYPMEVDSIVFRAAMYADNEGGEGFKVNGTNYTLSKGKLKFEDKVWTPTGEVDTIDIVQNKAAKGRFFLTSITVYPKTETPEPAAKFYVTGDSALVTDAGAPGKAWDPSAIKSMEDTLVLNLKGGVDYVLKVTLNGTWEGENNVKGYNELTEKTEGLNDVGKDHNIGFKLAEDGQVKVIYKTALPNDIFKVEGNFYVEPQGCDWDKIAFLGDGSPEQAYSNQFKVCVGDPAPKEIVNIQKPGFAAETGIYMTFESAAFGTISLPEGKYVKDGAGVVFYLSAFTAKETEVTVQNNNAIIEFTVYNDKGIAPAEPKFYVTGDSALVTDAGAPGKAWDPSAIVSMEDTLVLKLKANVDYLLKVTLNGTWEGENNVKGYNELTEKTEGLNDVSKDHNIGFKLTEAGEVKVVYNDSTFKLIGNFYVEPMDTIPTTAPAAPTVAENNVMAIYCNHYTTNNANFAISGWAGAYQTLTIDSTKIAFWKDMTWECVIDPVNTDAAHDFSEYKKLHVDIWAPKAAQIKFTVEAVAGGNYKDGKVVSLAKGWNSFDFDVAEWPGKYDFKNVKCFVLEQYSIEHTPFAIANIYFYDKPQWAAIKFTEVVPKDSLAADASFILLDSDFKAQITDTDNKMEIDANACRFGSAEGYDMFTHRLKTGGKSSAKNFITLTIPEDGKLAIAVRTGSNSATDRNLVIKQGNDTLFNQLILESQAIKVMEDTVEVSVYPYVSIPVEAGNVVLSYPVGSLNFYAFAFKPEPIPVYYMKNNWNEGQWLWREMTRNGLSYKLDSVVYGGNGVNYNTAESDEGATWVPDSMILGDKIAAKDTVSFVLNPIAKTVTANLVGKYVKPAGQLSCAEIYALADSAAVLMNGVVVTYVNGSNIFVKDETGAMLIYLPKNTSVAWKPGDILSNVRGIKVTYKGLVEVSPSQAQVAAVEAIAGYAPAPEELTFVNDSVDMNKYIIVKGIEFDADTAFVEGKNGTIKINLGNQALDLFNKFKLGYEFKAGKKYDIVAIVSYYNALQLYFVSAEAQVTTAYYLAGSMNGWTANEAYMFTANPANEGEYMLTTALAVNDEFKVIGVEGTKTTWYPDGMGNNYKVDDAHAGEAKTIYFRPEGGQEGWYAGYFFVEENELVKPTTAPAAPTAAEDDVLAIYCDQYKTNNLHFGISGWAGAYEVLDIDSTKIGYWTAMTWECIIDPVNTDAAHDLSGYKKLHVDLWAPKSAQIQVTVEAVAGGNYKDGQLVDLVQGWNSIDFVVADWKDGYDFKNVKCFVFEKYNIEGKPFAFANIYFYDKEAQGIENTNDNIKAIKRIENGMIIIEKNGKKYTITGQLVK